MKILKETTEWADPTPNHTYIIDNDKMIAYIRAGTTSVTVFRKPMMFNRKGRTFKEIKNQKIVDKLS